MAGLIPQERITDVNLHLQNNLLYMKVECINIHLIKMIIGPFFQHCRSIYQLSRSEALVDMVPKSDDLIEEVLSLSGLQEYRNRTFMVSIDLAHQHVPTSLITDYAMALVSPTVPDTLTSKYLLANRDWIEFRVRRNSQTSQSTYPLLDFDEKAENVSDITSLDPNAEEDKGSDTDTASNPGSEPGEEPDQVEEVVTPKSTGPKTPVRDPTETISSLEETKDDTVIRNKQTQTPKQSDFIPNIATPASPWHTPTPSQHTGHTPPAMPTPLKKELVDPPRHPPTPRDPFILEPIKKTKPIQDPPLYHQQKDPTIPTQLQSKPQPPKRKSSELLTIRNPEYTPSKKYYSLEIPQFGEEDPAQFKFVQPSKAPQNQQSNPKKPDTIDLLTEAVYQLSTDELHSFIGALISIDKERGGRSDHISLSPELNQARDPQMGGKVGVA